MVKSFCSPDEKEIAFVVRGEVFVMKNKEKAPKAHQITDNPSRDFNIIWAPESDSLVFISDRSGNYDLIMVVSDDPNQKRLSRALKYKLIRLTKSDENETAPRFSPDGKKISFIRGKGDLCVMDRDGKNENCIYFRTFQHKSWIFGVLSSQGTCLFGKYCVCFLSRIKSHPKEFVVKELSFNSSSNF